MKPAAQKFPQAKILLIGHNMDVDEVVNEIYIVLTSQQIRSSSHSSVISINHSLEKRIVNVFHFTLDLTTKISLQFPVPTFG